MVEKTAEIDMDLYSRQIGTLFSDLWHIILVSFIVNNINCICYVSDYLAWKPWVNLSNLRLLSVVSVDLELRLPRI